MTKEIKKAIFRGVIIGVVVGAILGLGNYFFLVPQIDKVVQKSQEAVTLIKSYEIEQQEFDNLKKDYQQVRPKSDQFFQLMPSKEELPQFAEQLTVVAELSEVSQDIEFSDNVQQDGTFYYLPIQITITGSMEQMIGYVDRLEELAYFIRFDSYSFSIKKGSNEMVLNITGKLYMRSDD